MEKSRAEKILGDPENTRCLCASETCERRGKCKECVALHRYNGSLPACLQQMKKGN